MSLNVIIIRRDNTWLSEHETFFLVSLSFQHLCQVFFLIFGFPRIVLKPRMIFPFRCVCANLHMRLLVGCNLGSIRDKNGEQLIQITQKSLSLHLYNKHGNITWLSSPQRENNSSSLFTTVPRSQTHHITLSAKSPGHHTDFAWSVTHHIIIFKCLGKRKHFACVLLSLTGIPWFSVARSTEILPQQCWKMTVQVIEPQCSTWAQAHAQLKWLAVRRKMTACGWTQKVRSMFQRRSLLQYLKRSSIFQKFRKCRNCIKTVFTHLNHHCEVSKQTDQRPTLQCLHQPCLYQPFSPVYFHTIGSMGRPETHKGCVMAILGL